MQPEGMRLDYKVERPNDLAKLIAAFANTLGGLIVLGVDADKTTNQPIWPPQKGMPTKPGIDEAITAIARDAIYPPVRVAISPIIENALLPGHSLAVVRVDESREAPHAVDDGRKIYERTGSGNKPYDFARLDRIEYLINRRRRIEDERETIRSKALARSRSLVSEQLKPIVWISVIPIYPWRDLCKPSTCYNHFRYLTLPSHSVQRIPDGGMFVSEVDLPEWGATIRDVMTCDARGHFLYIRGLVAITQYAPNHYGIYRQEELTDKRFAYESITERFGNMIAEARKFYEKPEVERPGLLSIRLGMEQTRGIQLYHQNARSSLDDPKPFLDDSYFHEIVLSHDELLSSDYGLSALFDRIAFAFDVSTPEGQ
jgi:hypothetical protein